MRSKRVKRYALRVKKERKSKSEEKKKMKKIIEEILEKEYNIKL